MATEQMGLEDLLKHGLQDMYYAEGKIQQDLVPVATRHAEKGWGLATTDEPPRPGTTVEDLAKLKPAFKEMGEVMPGFDKVALLKYPHLDRIEHIHHAGNSSGIVDGAAAVLIGSREWGEARGLKPRARIRASSRVARSANSITSARARCPPRRRSRPRQRPRPRCRPA